VCADAPLPPLSPRSAFAEHRLRRFKSHKHKSRGKQGGKTPEQGPEQTSGWRSKGPGAKGASGAGRSGGKGGKNKRQNTHKRFVDSS